MFNQLYPYFQPYPFSYSFYTPVSMTYYNPYNQLNLNMDPKRYNWQLGINKWFLLKDNQGKWIFGKLTSYDSATGKMELLALIDGDFKTIEQNKANISEAWLVDKWAKLSLPNTTLNVSGKWKTNWGEMILNQSGTKVTGTYTHNKGKIEGTLEDNIFTGTWSESPTYTPPDDAGNVELTFSDNSFKGKWGYGDNLDAGFWTGTRILTTSPLI